VPLTVNLEGRIRQLLAAATLLIDLPIADGERSAAADVNARALKATADAFYLLAAESEALAALTTNQPPLIPSS
jgi:hypothetical protein